MSVNIRRCAENALPAFINNDWHVAGAPATVENLEALVDRLVTDVSAEEVEPGDFYFVSTNRLCVEKRRYKDGDTDLEVFMCLGGDYDND